MSFFPDKRNMYKQSNENETREILRRVNNSDSYLMYKNPANFQILGSLIDYTNLIDYDPNRPNSNLGLIWILICDLEELKNEWIDFSKKSQEAKCKLLKFLSVIDEDIYNEVNLIIAETIKEYEDNIINIDRGCRPTKHDQNTDIFAYRLNEIQDGTTYFVNPNMLRNALGCSQKGILSRLFDQEVLIGEVGTRRRYTSKAPAYVGFKGRVYKLRPKFKL